MPQHQASPRAIALPPHETAAGQRPLGIRAMAVPRTLLLLWLPSFLLLIFALLPPLNHDVGALLHFTERWLGGERLYVDLIDVNPPLVFLLTAVPAWLGQLLGLSSVAALQAAFVLYIGWALYLCWRVGVQGSDMAQARAPERGWVLAVLLPFLAFAFPLEMFGQREHLMAVSVLPYLLLAERRAMGVPVPRAVVLAVAVQAGVMLALKPYFLLLPLMIEVALLVSLGPARALRQATPWIMAALWALYAAVLVLCFGVYLNELLGFVVGVYQRIDTSVVAAAVGKFGLPPLLGIAALAPFALRRRASVLARLAALAAIACWVGGVAQGKGWPYHMLPAEMFVLLLGGILAADAGAADWLARRLPRAAAFRAGAVLAALTLGVSAIAMAGSREYPAGRLHYDASEPSRLSALFSREAHGGQVLVLSQGISPYFPALNYAGSGMGMRFMTMWMLQGAYATCPAHGRRYNAVWEMSRAEFFAFRAVAADFAQSRPALVVIDRFTGIWPCAGEEFAYLAYFLRHPLFAEAFSHYEEIASPEPRLSVYRRID